MSEIYGIGWLDDGSMKKAGGFTFLVRKKGLNTDDCNFIVAFIRKHGVFTDGEKQKYADQSLDASRVAEFNQLAVDLIRLYIHDNVE